MIRILHSVSNMDRAGIETVLMNYYRHMDRTKVQFDFLCNKKKPGAFEAEIEAMGGRIFRTPGLNPLKFFKYQAYMKKLFQENPEYRIVEAHNGAFGLYSLIAAKHAGIGQLIFHAHGASIHKDWKLPLKLVCKWFLPRYMNQYFACGVMAAECYFGKKVVVKNQYRLINNAIDLDKFRYNPKVRERIRRDYNLEGKHIVGHVGRFMAQKNHAFLLDVFAALCKVDERAHLVLLGDGELQLAMMRKVEGLGLKDRVLFVGNVPNSNEWYQAFDVFVMPSIWEGLPLVGIEAQTADLPCIFSDTVTKEVGMLKKTCFLSVDAGLDCWVDKIQACMNSRERKHVDDVIAAHGYEIKTEAMKLQDIYLRLADEGIE